MPFILLLGCLYSGGLIFGGKFVLVIRGAYIRGGVYSGFYGIRFRAFLWSLEVFNKCHGHGSGSSRSLSISDLSKLDVMVT